MDFCCPVCGKVLISEEKRYVCGSGHSFDRARSGYVNLLLRQRHRRRGDDAEMAKARQIFLNAGYYQPLLDRLTALTAAHACRNIADIGCGEGWYSCAVVERLLSEKIDAALCGIDISPEILRFAAARAKQQGIAANTAWAVASVNRLPFADRSADCILNLFAPCEPDEFHRILQPDGILIRVIPLEKHLWELKTAVYDRPYENKPVCEAPAQFALHSFEKVQYQFTVPNAHLKALFAMTPYVHKTSPQDIAKLDNLDALTATAEFGILVCTPL